MPRLARASRETAYANPHFSTPRVVRQQIPARSPILGDGAAISPQFELRFPGQRRQLVKLMLRSFRRFVRGHASKVVYRVAGLPIAVRALRYPPRGQPGKLVRSAYRTHYWHPASISDGVELLLGLVAAPFLVIGMIVWFTARNGRTIHRVAGRSIIAQLGDQVWLYVKAGVLPPWYYIYELHRHPVKREARSFIQRCEGKDGVPALFRQIKPPTTDLNDKAAFARWCEARGVATVPVLAVVRQDGVDGLHSLDQLATDLFVKPLAGKGGRGASRWDFVGPGQYLSSDGRKLDAMGMLFAIAAESWSGPRMIQPRIRNHPDLDPLNNDALATVRALTCLNEAGEPELLGAVLRMAIGSNHVVDNLHAGGIAAAIDLASGRLGKASNLGMDCSLGWLDRHPTSGERIAGVAMPLWPQFRAFTEQAHRAFSDRILVGWDVAMTPDGLMLVEGNGNPDLDIMQRAYRRGWMAGRLGQLLAHHVVELGCVSLAEAA